MDCPPYVLHWIDSLCYWIRLSKGGSEFVYQSLVGFRSEEQAKADFMWWNTTNLI